MIVKPTLPIVIEDLTTTKVTAIDPPQAPTIVPPKASTMVPPKAPTITERKTEVI